MNVWQIAPPEALVNSISEYFINHGVALMWPGDAGRWFPDRYKTINASDNWISRFARVLTSGDAILLRTGPSRIRAVGLVDGEYSYEDCFDDVYGLDLQHCRRVRWFRLPQEYDFGEPVFTKGRFSRVKKASVREYVHKFLAMPPVHWQKAPLPRLPSEEPALEKIPVALESIVAQAKDLTQLFSDRRGFGDNPAEDELVAHFVVPFMRALGWLPEHIAIKWRHVDVALFDMLPRVPDNCRVIIEVKRIGAEVEDALDQAREYVRSLGVPADVLVTDGIRYRLYSCKDSFAPIAYANIVKLKKSAEKLINLLWRV